MNDSEVGRSSPSIRVPNARAAVPCLRKQFAVTSHRASAPMLLAPASDHPKGGAVTVSTTPPATASRRRWRILAVATVAAVAANFAVAATQAPTRPKPPAPRSASPRTPPTRVRPSRAGAPASSGSPTRPADYPEEVRQDALRQGVRRGRAEPQHRPLQHRRRQRHRRAGLPASRRRGRGLVEPRPRRVRRRGTRHVDVRGPRALRGRMGRRGALRTTTSTPTRPSAGGSTRSRTRSRSGRRSATRRPTS